MRIWHLILSVPRFSMISRCPSLALSRRRDVPAPSFRPLPLDTPSCDVPALVLVARPLCRYHHLAFRLITVLTYLSPLQAFTSAQSTFPAPSPSAAQRRSSRPPIPTRNRPCLPAPSSLRPRPNPRLQIRTPTAAEQHLLRRCQLLLHPPPSRVSQPIYLVLVPRSMAELVPATVVATAPEARPLAMDVPLITMPSKQESSSLPLGRLPRSRRGWTRPTLSRARKRLGSNRPQ